MNCRSHYMLFGRSVKDNELGGKCRTYGGQESSIEGSEGQRPLRKPWRKYEDNIKVDVQELGWGHVLD
jgi:hypothetical protein